MFSWKIVKQVVPQLTYAQHKGQLGKIGVIGGCREYTGAPFYAGIAAQRVVVFDYWIDWKGSRSCHDYVFRRSGDSY